MLGIITKTDMVRQMGTCAGAECQRAVSTVMTASVITCAMTDSLPALADRMKRHQLKNIPIPDPSGRPIGMLTARSVLRELLCDVEYKEAQLITYVKGVNYR